MVLPLSPGRVRVGGDRRPPLRRPAGIACCDRAVCDRGVRLGAADRSARPAVYRANLGLAGTAVANHAECAGESLSVIVKSASGAAPISALTRIFDPRWVAH